MSSASPPTHSATLLLIITLSKLQDKYYRTAFQPRSFEENLEFGVSAVAEGGVVQAVP